MEDLDLKSRISIDPEKRSGKPCIVGTRITVYDIFSQLAAGRTYDEILYDYPYLTKEDILACFAFIAAINSSLEIDIIFKLRANGWQLGDSYDFIEGELDNQSSDNGFGDFLDKIKVISKSRKIIENRIALSKYYVKNLFK